jgi:hypothetical protein
MITKTAFRSQGKVLHIPIRFAALAPIVASLMLFVASCGMIDPSKKGAAISGLTYTNDSIGMSISAPSTAWSITMNVPPPSKVLVINYGTGTSFNPNVVVSASPAQTGDSLPAVTLASISEFCNDSSFSNQTIFYSGQTTTTINGSQFGTVMANVTKSYTSAGQPATITLEIMQYVTIHNGMVIVFTFLDSYMHFQVMDQDFVSIRESIKLF